MIRFMVFCSAPRQALRRGMNQTGTIRKMVAKEGRRFQLAHANPRGIDWASL